MVFITEQGLNKNSRGGAGRGRVQQFRSSGPVVSVLRHDGHRKDQEGGPEEGKGGGRSTGMDARDVTAETRPG